MNEYYQPCMGDGVYCSLNSAIKHVESDVYMSISSHMRFNGLSFKELRKAQAATLIKKMEDQKIDTSFLSKCVNFFEWDIDPIEIRYQLFNEDSSKLIFLTYSKGQNNLEESVTIARSIRAFYYNEKWYAEEEAYYNSSDELSMEDVPVYFLADDFFLKHSDQINPDFWNVNTFKKVSNSFETHKREIEVCKRHLADKTTSESDKEYCRFVLEQYEREDESNKPYLGMYVIVADELKAENEDFR